MKLKIPKKISGIAKTVIDPLGITGLGDAVFGKNKGPDYSAEEAAKQAAFDKGQAATDEFVAGGPAKYEKGADLAYEKLSPAEKLQWQSLSPAEKLQYQSLAPAEKLQWQSLSPAEKQAQSGMADIKTDAKYKDHEMAALRELEDQSQNGFTARDKADMARTESEVNRANKGRLGAIQQNMQARGMSGSGMDLVAQMQSSQDANEIAAMRALEQEGMMQDRKSQATMNLGQMSSQLQSRDFGQEATKAQAQDAINRFNTQNSNDNARYNNQGQNQAAQNNWQQTNSDNRYNNQNINQTAQANWQQTNSDNRYNNQGMNQANEANWQQTNSDNRYNNQNQNATNEANWNRTNATNDLNSGAQYQFNQDRLNAKLGQSTGAFNYAQDTQNTKMQRNADAEAAAGGKFGALLGIAGAVGGGIYGGPEGARAGAQVGSGVGNQVGKNNYRNQYAARGGYVGDFDNVNGYDDSESNNNWGMKADARVSRGASGSWDSSGATGGWGEDDYSNDVVPTMLSPGEVVIPKSHAKSPEKAAKFVAKLQSNPHEDSINERNDLTKLDPAVLNHLAKSNPSLVEAYQKRMAEADAKVNSAKDMAKWGGYADVAGNLLTDFNNSQRKDIILGNRLQDMGKKHDRIEAEKTSWKSVAPAFDRGVAEAESARNRDEDVFNKETQLGIMDKANAKEAKSNDPSSAESASAREFLKKISPQAASMAGFDNLTEAQINKMAPDLYKSYNDQANRDSDKYRADQTTATTRRGQDLDNAKAVRDAGKSKLPSVEQQKLNSNTAMGYKGVLDMRAALLKGDNTFSLIGDNNFTESQRRAAEAFGRMQSGGAINKDEEKRFIAMGPGVGDSKKMQLQKLAKQQAEFEARMREAGVNPQEALAARGGGGSAPAATKKYDWED